MKKVASLVIMMVMVVMALASAPMPVRAQDESGCEQPTSEDYMGIYCLCRYYECMAECYGSGPTTCKTACSWQKQLCNQSGGPWVN